MGQSLPINTVREELQARSLQLLFVVAAAYYRVWSMR